MHARPTGPIWRQGWTAMPFCPLRPSASMTGPEHCLKRPHGPARTDLQGGHVVPTPAQASTSRSARAACSIPSTQELTVP